MTQAGMFISDADYPQGLPAGGACEITVITTAHVVRRSSGVARGWSWVLLYTIHGATGARAT